MTMIPPASQPINVSGFPAYLSPYPNVQSFSYQDGLTFQKLFESYRTWILETLVPHVNSQTAETSASYNAASLALSEAMKVFSDTSDESLTAIRDSAATAVAAAEAAKAAENGAIANALATITPLGNGQDDAPVINAALKAFRRVVLIGTFTIKQTIYMPDNTILDASGATILSDRNWFAAMLSAECQRDLVGSPRGLAVATRASGTLEAGAYYYSVSAVTATGETMVAPTKKITTTATGGVTVSWEVHPLATSYRVWRGTTGRLYLLGSTNDAVYIDNGAVTSGTIMPERNTTFGRTVGAKVIGGVWDVNGKNRPASGQWPTQGYWAGHGFDFQHVDDLVIDGVTVKDAPKWAIAIADFGNLRTDNLTFDTGSDGIHVLGPGVSWSADNVKGNKTGDDTFGISLAEWANYAVSRGSIGSVRLTNARQEVGHSFVRVLGADGYKIGSLTIDGISGNYSGQFRGGIYLWDNADGTSWPSRTVVDQVSISNIDVVMTGSPVAPSPYGGNGEHGVVILSGAKYGQVKLDNIKGRTLNGLALKGVVEVGGSDIAGPMVINSFIASQVSADCPVANPFATITFRENAQIDNATLRDVSFNSDTTNGQIVKVFGASSFVRSMTIINPNRNSLDTTGASFEIASSGRVGTLTIQNVNNLESYRAIDVYAGTQIDSIVFDGVTNPYGYLQELARIASTTPCTVVLRNVNVPNIAHEPVRLRSGANVTVLSAGGVNTGTIVAAITEAGYGSLRITGSDLLWRLGVSKLTPAIGDMLQNTDNTNAGKGVVVTDGNTWKNLFTNATWVNS